MNLKSLFPLVVIATAIPTIALAQSPANTFIEQNSRTLAWMIVLYILPSFVALYRKHPSKYSIILVNVLLGFTGVGWIVALIWSFSSTKQTVVIANAAPIAVPVQSASTALPLATKTVAERIAELKVMLDQGTISQSEFEILKADALKGLG